MQDVFHKITFRLVPFLVLLYIVAFLDRVNIGFAALSMNKDLGISNSLFGLAAGMFFVGYFICEVPSNLLMAKMGARRWITRIMVTWGIVSVCMAFVHGGLSYVAVRFLLGAAEAGFFPGVIFYLTMWLPPAKRAGIMSLFVFAIPLANVVGGPISAAILRTGLGGGLRGWQWLFLLEGIPAILCGALVPFVLPDGPWEADWLSREQKRIVDRALLGENSVTDIEKKLPMRSLFTPFLCVATITYFTLMLGLYALSFWLPQILTSVGSSALSVGWDSAIPYGAGGLIAVVWAYHSDHTAERRWHLFSSFIFAALGACIAGSVHSKMATIIGFTLASAGIFSAMPMFWAEATKRIAGMRGAASIAVINSLGNLGGFVGPSWMGLVRGKTHTFSAGLFSVSCSLLCGAVAFALISPEAITVQHTPSITEGGR